MSSWLETVCSLHVTTSVVNTIFNNLLHINILNNAHINNDRWSWPSRQHPRPHSDATMLTPTASPNGFPDLYPQAWGSICVWKRASSWREYLQGSGTWHQGPVQWVNRSDCTRNNSTVDDTYLHKHHIIGMDSFETRHVISKSECRMD